MSGGQWAVGSVQWELLKGSWHRPYRHGGEGLGLCLVRVVCERAVGEHKPVAWGGWDYCLLPTAYSCCVLRTACCLLLTTSCLLLTTYSSLLTPHCSLLTTLCPLLTTSYVLLTTYYLLLATYYLLCTTYHRTTYHLLLTPLLLTTYYLPAVLQSIVFGHPPERYVWR